MRGTREPYAPSAYSRFSLRMPAKVLTPAPQERLEVLGVPGADPLGYGWPVGGHDFGDRRTGGRAQGSASRGQPPASRFPLHWASSRA